MLIAIINLKPTYEGLKVILVFRQVRPPTNLKPTYEGLKAKCGVGCLCLGEAYLKPTYEGLKEKKRKGFELVIGRFEAYL